MVFKMVFATAALAACLLAAQGLWFARGPHHAIAAAAEGAALPAAPPKTWGWRGDGTGRFPDADPPLRWGRASATLQGLTTEAEKPADGRPGANPATLGNIPEWLVLGPLDYDPEAPRKDLLAKEFVPGEAALAPAAAGERAGGAAWRKVPSTGSLLNLNNHYKDMSAKVFYAHAWLHAKTGVRVLLRLMGPTCRFWLNGQDILSMEETSLRHTDKEVELKPGWNSLLVKVLTTRRKDDWAIMYNSPPDSGYFQVVMWGRSVGEAYQSTNIRWEAPLPQALGFSCAQPIVIGDRVIVAADPSFVICFDKNTGKRLWIDYCGHHEFVTEQERSANAEIFAQIDPKAARIKEIAAAWQGTVQQDVELHALVKDLHGLLRKVDREKYTGVWDRAKQEAGAALMPATDGKFVYTWFADGVAVCHDQDGKRKWMTLENEGVSKNNHGYVTPPLLTDAEFVVSMVNAIAFDKETGKVVWKIPQKTHNGPSPFLPADPVGADNTPCVNVEHVGLYKPASGFFPWPHATIARDRAYVTSWDGAVFGEFTIPPEITPGMKLNVRRVDARRERERDLLTTGSWAAAGVVGNALVHDGLIYTVGMGGPLRVYDQRTLELVYSVRLDLNTIMFAYPYPHGSGVCASPALGGKYIYIFGNDGHSMVIKLGRTFEVVAENRVERLLPGGYEGILAVPSDKAVHPECTVSSPIFDGKRIYYQAEGYLYCIEGK